MIAGRIARGTEQKRAWINPRIYDASLLQLEVLLGLEGREVIGANKVPDDWIGCTHWIASMFPRETPKELAHRIECAITVLGLIGLVEISDWDDDGSPVEGAVFRTLAKELPRGS